MASTSPLKAIVERMIEKKRAQGIGPKKQPKPKKVRKSCSTKITLH